MVNTSGIYCHYMFILSGIISLTCSLNIDIENTVYAEYSLEFKIWKSTRIFSADNCNGRISVLNIYVSRISINEVLIF